MSTLSHVDQARRSLQSGLDDEEHDMQAPFMERENSQHGIIPGHVEYGPQASALSQPPSTVAIAPGSLRGTAKELRERRGAVEVKTPDTVRPSSMSLRGSLGANASSSYHT